MAELLIVDDSRVVRSGLKALFVDVGFTVREARDGAEAVRLFAERRPDAVLLDVMMPRINGFLCCEQMRQIDQKVPILFLTALESDSDQVRGWGCQADDYIFKTASQDVLVARVRRALQRASGRSHEAFDTEEVRLGAVKVDLTRMIVTDENGEKRRLTKTEGDIFRLLVRQGDRPISVDRMIAALRGEGFACEDNMLYVHICNLRRKLGKAAARIVNDRLTGYRLVRG